jgi:hypothetical protein
MSAASAALAGKFKPVHSEDWPETGDEAPKSEDGASNRDPDSESGDDSGTSQPTKKIRLLPDGTPDPDSLKDYLR